MYLSLVSESWLWSLSPETFFLTVKSANIIS